MSHLSWRRRAALVAIPVVLIACAVLLTASIERQSALHAGDQAQAAQRLLTGMLDEETGARGFFATREPSFLAPWSRGQSEFSSALAQSRALAGGDTPLDQSLTEQAALSARWRGATAREIAALRAQGRRPTVATEVSQKDLMDDFRQLNALYLTQLTMRRDRALSTASWLAVALATGLSGLMILAALIINQRVTRRESGNLQRQQELRELLQVSDSEEESQLLLIRHVQRSVPGSVAAVLNRNASQDRLECRLSPDRDSATLDPLEGQVLKPRSCLAVRLSRGYRQRPGEDPLLRCDACGKLAADVRCEPLLVGGQVIGSVLVARQRPIGEAESEMLRGSVILAAPILANQRNLAVAERRAASDALTGLPNRRAADETLRRMIAHAGRTLTPLAAVLLDLDHFKQVNDLYGHDRGDQALAAIGQVLAHSLRASDFAARYGGEEFLLLLPDTDRAAALQVAEKLRRAVERTELREIGNITASLGIASLPEDAVEPEDLLRRADRALYAAKARGRNRVEVSESSGATSQGPPLLPPTD